MEFQLWNNLCSDTAKYGCLGLLNAGSLKEKLEVVLTDQKMKLLIVLKAGTVVNMIPFIVTCE